MDAGTLSRAAHRGRKQISDPIRVFVLYTHFRNGEWHHKHMVWHLFANENNLDKYDWAYQGIHKKFVDKEKTCVGFAQYNVEDFHDFSVEGSMLVEDMKGKDEPQNLCFNFQVPLFREEFLRKVCRETIIVPEAIVADEDIDAALSLAQQRLQEFYNRS